MQGYSVPNKFIAAQGKYILIMNLYAALIQWITIHSIQGSLTVDRSYLSVFDIITKGPLPETETDFWRLIWQERVPTIIMLTNEVNRFKCQQYWPDSGKKQCGPFQVIIADQQIFADYTIRIFSVSVNYASLKMSQYNYDAAVILF